MVSFSFLSRNGEVLPVQDHLIKEISTAERLRRGRCPSAVHHQQHVVEPITRPMRSAFADGIGTGSSLLFCPLEKGAFIIV